MNTGGSSSSSDHCGAVDGFTGWISIASLRFIPVELSLNLIIFILSIDSILAAF